MKISTSGALGVKDHTYTVDAYTSGYGQGAVRKVEVRAIDTNDKVDGKLTFFNPQKMDKGSGVYDSTYTFEENDKHAIDYSCGTHKVEFDVVTNLGSTITEGALPGLEAGYNGTPGHVTDTNKYKQFLSYKFAPAKVTRSGGAGQIKGYVDPSSRTSLPSALQVGAMGAVIGETLFVWLEPPAGYRITGLGTGTKKPTMADASGTLQDLPDTILTAATTTLYTGATHKLVIPNVTGKIQVYVLVST